VSSRTSEPCPEDKTALIEQFIWARGLDPAKLHDLPDDERKQLVKEAAADACSRLAEMESRAHYVHELHGDHWHARFRSPNDSLSRSHEDYEQVAETIGPRYNPPWL
jgi:hypothetical protein